MEIQPVLSEGDQPWDFFGGNDAEAETPVLWPPDKEYVKAVYCHPVYLTYMQSTS